MTSSLVGSEMCIRDSIRAVVCCPDTQQMLWVGEPYRPQMVLLYWHKHWTCLLYTSDAADDM
eukprot:7791642-Prorocentrum_lima.AAC.1